MTRIQLTDAIDLTIKEVALICRRSPKTIRNLVYLHQLPRRFGREPVRGYGMSRRIMLLAPATVRRLRHLTGA